MNDLLHEFMLLAAGAMLGQPVINFLTRHWAFMWREEITRDYISRWLAVQKAEPGGQVEKFASIDSPSQRVQDDAYRFSRFIDRLGQGWYCSRRHNAMCSRAHANMA